MAINKNFVIKNGVEINTSLIVGDATLNKVGVGTTVPGYTLHVGGSRGGIGATDITITGIATVGTSGSTSAALNVLGISTFQGDINLLGSAGVTTISYDASLDKLNFVDNARATFGTGNDLQIYHEGTYSYISNQTGDLRIDAKDGERGIVVIPDSSVELYYGNTKTFNTTPQGINVTGVTTSTRLNVAGISTLDGGVRVGTAASIYTNGNVAFAGLATANGGLQVGTAVSVYTNGNIAAAGIVTANGGLAVGVAATIQSNGAAAFVGVVTVGSDLHVGGDLFISEDLVLDTNLNILGIATLGILHVTGIGTIDSDVRVGGASTFVEIAKFEDDLVVGVSTFFVDKSTGRIGIGTSVPATTLDVAGALTANSAKVEDLTDNRVVIAGDSGELEDDANLTFNGSTLSVGVDLDVDGHTELDNLNVSGLSTFVGFSTFNDSVFIQSNLSVGGITTSNSYTIDGTTVITSGRELQNIASLDATTTATIESAIASGPNTFDDLKVTGISTFIGIATFGSGVGIADSIFHLEDNTTSFRFPSDGTFTVEATGTERLRVNENGVNIAGLITASSGGKFNQVDVGKSNINGITGDVNLTLDAGAGAGGAVIIASDVGLQASHNLIVSGITTLGIASATNFTADSVIVGSAVTINNTGVNITGVSTFVGFSTFNDSVFVQDNLSVGGITTSNSYTIDGTTVITSGRELQNIASLDATTTATIESAIANAPNTFTDITVTGISTLGVTSTTNLTSQQLNVSGISTFAGEIDANGGVTANTAIVEDLTDNRVVIVGTGGELEDDSNFTFDGAMLKVGTAATIAVNGNAAFAGIVTVGGNLNVIGDIVYDEITGRNLNITGISTQAGQVNFGTSGVGATVFANGNVTVSGILTATSFVGSFAGSIDGAASQVTVADESSDTTCFPLFVTAATGDLAPKSGTNLTFNSDTGALIATSFAGNISGGTVSGTTGTFSGDVTVGSGVTIKGNGGVSIAGITTVNGNLLVGGNSITVGSGVTIKGNGGVSIAGITTVNGNLLVGGNSITVGSGASVHSGGNAAFVGVVTAGRGFNIGIQSAGIVVAKNVGISTLNFLGAGNSITYHAASNTLGIDIAGSSGGGGVSEVSTNVSSTSATGVGSFAVATHRSAAIIAQIDQGANYQVGRYLMIHDGTTATVIEESAIATGSMLGSFTADVNNSNAEFKVTMSSSGIATVTTKIDTVTV